MGEGCQLRGGGPIDITARYQNIHGGRFLDAYNIKDLMKVLICLGCDPKQVFIFYIVLLYDIFSVVFNCILWIYMIPYILISIIYIHTLFIYTYQYPDVDNRQGGHTCSNIYGTGVFF